MLLFLIRGCVEGIEQVPSFSMSGRVIIRVIIMLFCIITSPSALSSIRAGGAPLVFDYGAG
jgi:hypothetical protein